MKAYRLKKSNSWVWITAIALLLFGVFCFMPESTDHNETEFVYRSNVSFETIDAQQSPIGISTFLFCVSDDWGFKKVSFFTDQEVNLKMISISNGSSVKNIYPNSEEWDEWSLMFIPVKRKAMTPERV